MEHDFEFEEQLHLRAETKSFAAPSWNEPFFLVAHSSGAFTVRQTAQALTQLIKFLKEEKVLDATHHLVAKRSELARVGSKYRKIINISWTWSSQINPKEWDQYTSMALWLMGQGIILFEDQTSV
jgi:hypothetical protein